MTAQFAVHTSERPPIPTEKVTAGVPLGLRGKEKKKPNHNSNHHHNCHNNHHTYNMMM